MSSVFRYARYVLILVLVMGGSATAAPVAPELKEGRWDITLQTEATDSTRLPIIQSLCLSRQEPVPQAIDPKKGCTLLSVDVQGNTVFWVAECRGEGGLVRSNGNATYAKTKVEGQVQVTVTPPGQPVQNSLLKLSGKRSGSCR